MRPMPRPFLAHIQEDAPSLLLDLGHGGGQLLAAVTAEGAEGVAGEALGVDPAEDVLAVADVPLDQGDVVLSVQAVHEAVGNELAVFGGQFHRSDPIYQLFMALTIVLQVPNGDELDVVPFGQLCQLRSTHHGAVLPHDLAAQTALSQPRQPAQVHRGLGVAVPLQHAVLLGQQREHMARPAEILRLGARPARRP